MTLVDTIKKISPPWLQAGNAEKFLFGLGLICDVQIQRIQDTVLSRFPLKALAGALSYIGSDRRLMRGINETDTSYALRLSQAFTDWHFAGLPRGVLKQLLGFTAKKPRIISVDNQNQWYWYDAGADSQLPPEKMVNDWSVLIDGDMEDPSMTYWTEWSSTCSKYTNSPHSGTQCLRVHDSVGYNNSSAVQVLPVGTYRVHGYARSDGFLVPFVSMTGGFDWSGTNSRNWQEFDFVVDANWVGLCIGKMGTNIGSVYFDDVTITNCAWDWDGDTTSWRNWIIICNNNAGVPWITQEDNWGVGTWGDSDTEAWGIKSTCATSLSRIVEQFRAVHSKCEKIIIAFNSNKFDPYDTTSYPIDGTWGKNHKVVGGVAVAAREPTGRYLDGTPNA
jgi:hypothetical protein